MRRPFYKDALRIIPICFAAGAGIEFFMIQTGFYPIVTRKEAERRAEQLALEQERRERIAQLKREKKLDE